MDVNIIQEIKDGDPTRSVVLLEAPSVRDISKQKPEVNVKKKRRRGKSKRKVMKPFSKIPWQERRKVDNSKITFKRNNRFRKIIVSKTQAPFNNNQFLMEIHKPEPENSFQILTTPSARTRDSSFSVDSEDNYFYSLPDDEEEYLTKEFSSVYEDAQTERLSNMSKNELIQEYLLLEAKYDNLVKRTERNKVKEGEDKDSSVDKDTSATDKESMLTDRDTSETSAMSDSMGEPSLKELLQRMKEQEEQLCEMQLVNEKLRKENESLRQRAQDTSEDSESDSSSSSDSGSTSSCKSSPARETLPEIVANGNHMAGSNDLEMLERSNDQRCPTEPLVNGFHSPH